MIDLIKTEARALRTVFIVAQESDGSREAREVEPYSLRQGKAGRPRLYFYCLKKQGLRNVYLDHILSAEATGRSFSPRWSVEF